MKSIRLVIVDDHADYRSALAMLLVKIDGVAIAGQAATAEQALAMVMELQPDLVLVDVVLPGMSGFDLTRQLKALTLPPQVIILTMHTLASYRTAALSAGADAFMSKDQVIEQLPQVIYKLFPALPAHAHRCVGMRGHERPLQEGDPT